MAIHALLGCDTTSRIHGIGKGMALKKFENDSSFRKNLCIFNDHFQDAEQISKSGEILISKLYGSSDISDLRLLRYATFCKKLISSKKHTSPEVLPLTADALKWHSLRVYHQVQTWKGVHLNAEEQGWIVKGNFLFPKLMSQAAGPSELLTIVRCNCKGDCGTGRCTCLKNNMKCSPMCGTCKGVTCLNHQEREGEHCLND